VSIKLKAPFTPLTAVLADRAGMIMSPDALKSAGAEFASNPVCVGPFKFASRVAQDRIEVVKDPNYYGAADVKLDRVIYRIIADGTTRFNNLRAGDVEVLDTVAATDVDALRADSNLRLVSSDSLATRASRSTSATSTGSARRRARWPLRTPVRWPPTCGSAGRSS
jgi:peptide/nickel transport system substrate-binding protein